MRENHSIFLNENSIPRLAIMQEQKRIKDISDIQGLRYFTSYRSLLREICTHNEEMECQMKIVSKEIGKNMLKI